jgi:trans-aconitate methyltransferase
LDKTRDHLTEKLDEMYTASCSQHAELAKKLSDVEKFKDKWVYTILGATAVLGWVTGHSETIAKFLN